MNICAYVHIRCSGADGPVRNCTASVTDQESTSGSCPSASSHRRSNSVAPVSPALALAGETGATLFERRCEDALGQLPDVDS
jgi:hypothetical protein